MNCLKLVYELNLKLKIWVYRISTASLHDDEGLIEPLVYRMLKTGCVMYFKSNLLMRIQIMCKYNIKMFSFPRNVIPRIQRTVLIYAKTDVAIL